MSHARLGPSNHRWPHCPGSVRHEAKYPNVSGEAAIDGTGSHLLLETCIETNEPASAFVGALIGANHVEKPTGWIVDDERAARVQMCLDYIDRRVQELEIEYPDADIAVDSETISNPGEQYGRDDWWGTVDITITVTGDNRILFVEVVDYKDGRGWVHVECNSQLIAYLGGKTKDCDLRVRLRMTIVQPKTQPPVRYVDISSQQLFNELEKLSVAAAATDAFDAPLVAGKHCQWCKHKPNCTTQTEGSVQIMNELSTTSDLSILTENPESLPSEQLGKLMSAKEGIMAAFDKIQDEIQRRIEAGDTVEGWAMLPGNSRRVWNCSDAEVDKALRSRRLKDSEIYIRSIVSPAQCMKLPQLTDRQKETIERDLVTVLAGKLTLKKVSKKEKIDAAELFADVTKPQPVISFL